MNEYCPKCKKLKEFKFYDGALGYESLVCSKCGFDMKDITIKDLTELYNIRNKINDEINDLLLKIEGLEIEIKELKRENRELGNEIREMNKIMGDRNE